MIDKMFVATKAFVIHEGKVLLVRESSRYTDGGNAGKFDVIGGRVEPGQHFAESLHREIAEEIGIEIKMGKPFFVNEWRPEVRGEKWHIVGMFFECTPQSLDIILSEDHDEYIWIDPAEYAKFPIIENLKPVFEAYLAQ